MASLCLLRDSIFFCIVRYCVGTLTQPSVAPALVVRGSCSVPWSETSQILDNLDHIFCVPFRHYPMDCLPHPWKFKGLIHFLRTQDVFCLEWGPSSALQFSHKAKMQISLTTKHPRDCGAHVGRGVGFVLPIKWAQSLTSDNRETFHHFPTQPSDYSTASAQWNYPLRNLKRTKVSLSTNNPIWIPSWQTGGHLDMHLLFCGRCSLKTEGSYRQERFHWSVWKNGLSKNIWAKLDNGKIFMHGVSSSLHCQRLEILPPSPSFSPGSTGTHPETMS